MDGGDEADRILLNDILEKYMPDYECMLLQLKDYSNEQLMEKRDEISIMLMIDKLRDMAEFVTVGEKIDSEWLRDITNSNFPHQKWDSHLEKSIL